MKVKYVIFFISIFITCGISLVIILNDSKQQVDLKNTCSQLNLASDICYEDKHIYENINDIADNYVNKKSKIELWRVIEKSDNSNNELQSYCKANVIYENESIKITSLINDYEAKKYTSGMVKSNYAYLYGTFEFTIEVCEGQGIFPAIWMLPKDDKSLPEIDIFEMIGSEPNIFYGVNHYIDTFGKQNRSYFMEEVSTKPSYKISLDWQKDSLTWFIDDKKIFSTNTGVYNSYMYIIINQAIGGNWPGDPDSSTIFPCYFNVTNIKVNATTTVRRN
ncbi:glycoside hydrolase family 16 protein [Sedimentibacter sp. zth1]|uniref:glycoside hydrolase family 16 protein n=1 Tax=Sedimentibacter sp. zth1 TaxID=2816908 RepID=UPI001A91DA12|nr:glycoside hydrolase family 16 protein [Sedimentibacter sp. zth1]QSX05778.1 glycoside hydrolase family 16 protein [Sedimentibacter sp. zth1]